MRFLYSILIALYGLLIRSVAPFNPKARAWVRGRESLLQRMSSSLSGEQRSILWFHCASAGEFEQGRPLIEALQDRRRSHAIALTFFSPSGYELRKKYPGADYVFYLPLDTRSNARKIVSLLRPSAVFFIKYEFWFNLLDALRRKNVPVFLVSGIFRRNQHFFAAYGGWFRKQLQAFDWFFLQTEESARLLDSIGLKRYSVAGDTRFDRVLRISEQAVRNETAEDFARDRTVMVCGSTWPEDESMVNGAAQNFALIVAPHETGESQLRITEKNFAPRVVVRYSRYVPGMKADVLLVDNVGMLSSLYRYGQVAYVGGGFGKGIHNVLEAACAGIPVLFGPNHVKFAEAQGLLAAGGAFEVNSADTMRRHLQLLSQPGMMRGAGLLALQFVQQRAGATSRIMKVLEDRKVL